MLSLSLGVPLAIVSIIGLLMNGYIVLVVILTKQIASANNVLLLHLGLVDSLLCLAFLIFSLPSVGKPGGWLVTLDTPCTVHGFLLTLLHPIALWTVCGLNCDRFYAISAPLHYSAIVNPKKVVIGLGFGWILAIALSIPPFFGIAPFRYGPHLGGCAPDFTAYGSLWYGITFTFVTLLLPGIIIVGCNLKVLMIARYHRHRIASAIYEVTLSAQVTITHQRNPFFVPTVTAPSAGGPKFRSRSPVSSVLQLVGSFMLLYCPYYVVILWESATNSIHPDGNIPEPMKVNQILIVVASTLLTCSSFVNGLLYGLKSKVMRKTFQNYWRKQMSKNEMNHEIQARTPSTCGSRRPSLTPLGFLGRPCLQRRMSETLIDIERGNSGHQKPQMKRIASELTWRPISLTFAGLDSPSLSSRPRPSIPHTASCNTLQVPRTDNEIASADDQEFYLRIKNSFRSALQNGNPRVNTGFAHNSATTNNHKSNLSTANLLLHKVLRLEHGHDTLKRLAPSSPKDLHLTSRRSPRILITRAFSEESDKTPSMPGSPGKDGMHRQYSSSTALIERKWKMVKYKDEERGSDSEADSHKPETSSNSTTTSEASCRRYSSLDDRTSFGGGRDSETEAAEEQLLLSWPTTRRKIINHKQTKSTNGTGRMFRANPLYSDRSDEPEVIL